MQGDVFTAEYFLCHGVLVLNFHMQYNKQEDSRMAGLKKIPH